MRQAFIGFDVGGTNIAAGIVSPHGRILKFISHPAEAKKGKKLFLNFSKLWICWVSINCQNGILTESEF